MRIEEIRVPVYRFKELSTEAQARAIADQQEVFRQDLDHALYQVTEELEAWLEDSDFCHYADCHKDISWSLGGSQGDGVAFYGRLSDAATQQLAQSLLGPEQARLALQAIKDGIVSIRIARNQFGYRYSHENTMEVVADIRYSLMPPEQDEAIDALVDAIGEDIKRVSLKLKEHGLEVLEWLHSEERAREQLELENAEIFLDTGATYRSPVAALPA